MRQARARAGSWLAASSMLATGIISGVGLASDASAADTVVPPTGQWTRIGADQFEHFGCKVSLGDGRWRVKTATYRTARDAPPEIGIYAAIIKGRGEQTATVIDSVDTNAWERRWVYTRALVGSTDRNHALWMQCSCYGPPAYDGDLRMPIRNLTDCG